MAKYMGDKVEDRFEKIYSQVDKILREKYGICHVTIQAEYHRGKDEDFFDTVVDEEHLIK